MGRWLLMSGAVALALGCAGEVDDGGGGGAADAGSSGGADADTTDYGVGEPDDLAGLTVLHNQARAEVGVGPLTWDDQLEDYARAWAEQCVDNGGIAGLIDHNPSTPYGENIAGGSTLRAVEQLFAQWYDEKADYDYASGSCSGICGHYTQIVWANSSKVGCARYDCPGLQYRHGLVCSYDPPGNFNGQKPY
ncbi:MAG: hypothetical protein KJO07_06070 [Deltaproteobacteria bacterium]|nr:hypothetical protein [Deltaproteobacteria bacterium]